MYVLILILLLFAAGFSVFCFRKKRIICKICRMNSCDKICLLNSLTEPYGFFWLPSQNIISSTWNAWQREFGYCTLYDRTAVYFNMVFDCEPIYFNYGGYTWLIEFWKGQYGINTGCEVGIYRADTVLDEKDLDRTLFHSVPDKEMLLISMKLFAKNKLLFCTGRIHWWLTGFLTGDFHDPSDLTMHLSITFPDPEMKRSFLTGLRQAGYKAQEPDEDGLTVSVCFLTPHTKAPRRLLWFYPVIAQWKNRMLCRLYLAATRPFTHTPDRLLCLYYLLPSAFRRLLRFSRNRNMKPHHRNLQKRKVRR